jgi:hypothetical protein
MKTKLTLKEKLFKFFGMGYLVNIGTGEIHRLKFKHPNCRTEMIANGIFVTKKTAKKLMKLGRYNGCRFCWKEKDLG